MSEQWHIKNCKFYRVANESEQRRQQKSAGKVQDNIVINVLAHTHMQQFLYLHVKRRTGTTTGKGAGDDDGELGPVILES